MNAKVKKHRSPSYPAIDLPAAVKLARKLYPAALHALGVEVIAQQLGYKSMTSCSSYVAALKQFGLLREEKGGPDRMLRLTDRGLDIGVDREGQSNECQTAIEQAALTPTLYAELWDKWQTSLPPDAEIRRYLERERRFNPKHVGTCIADYKSTLDFAGLTGRDIMEVQEQPPEDENDSVRVTHEKAMPERKPGPMTQFTALPPSEAGPFISFPLPAGNMIEIRLRSKVSQKDFEQIKKLVDLSGPSLVSDEGTTETNQTTGQ